MYLKRTFLLTIVLISASYYSQVAIGKQNIDGDAILDFASGDKRGIILPWTNNVSNPANGTFTFDLVSKKVVYYGNNQWHSLSDVGLSPSSVNADTDVATKGVIIGASASTANGVLVLESNSKALVLPKVNNASVDIVNPSSGTICYDLSVDALAVFNGSVWSYWK